MLKNRPVYALGLVGGLHVILTQTPTGFESLGTGTNREIAKFVAQRSSPEIQFDDLCKTERPVMSPAMVREFEELNRQINSALRRR